MLKMTSIMFARFRLMSLVLYWKNWDLTWWWVSKVITSHYLGITSVFTIKQLLRYYSLDRSGGQTDTLPFITACHYPIRTRHPICLGPILWPMGHPELNHSTSMPHSTHLHTCRTNQVSGTDLAAKHLSTWLKVTFCNSVTLFYLTVTTYLMSSLFRRWLMSTAGTHPL